MEDKILNVENGPIFPLAEPPVSKASKTEWLGISATRSTKLSRRTFGGANCSSPTRLMMCDPVRMGRTPRSSSRRCRVQGHLHDLALTVAARSVRTVTLGPPDSELTVRPRLDGNGLCGTVGPMSPDKDEHSVKGTAALSLVYVTCSGWTPESLSEHLTAGICRFPWLERLAAQICSPQSQVHLAARNWALLHASPVAAKPELSLQNLGHFCVELVHDNGRLNNKSQICFQ